MSISHKTTLVDLSIDSSDEDPSYDLSLDSKNKNECKNHLNDNKRIKLSTHAILPTDHHLTSDKSNKQPFYLLKSLGLSTKFEKDCLSLHDVLAVDYPIKSLVMCNYMIDIDYLLLEYPILYTINRIICIHGADIPKNSSSAYPSNIMTYKVDLGMERFGTFHCKFLMLFTDVGMRFSLFTSNFIEKDLQFLTNGVFTQDFPKTTNSKTKSMNNDFKSYLIDYLIAIRLYKCQDVIQEIISNVFEYDFTAAEVCLLGSVPGRFDGKHKLQWGQCRLQQLLKESKEFQKDPMGKKHLVLQCSSIGSLKANEKYLEELIDSMSNHLQSQTDTQLVWPSVKTIKNSLLVS